MNVDNLTTPGAPVQQFNGPFGITTYTGDGQELEMEMEAPDLHNANNHLVNAQPAYSTNYNPLHLSNETYPSLGDGLYGYPVGGTIVTAPFFTGPIAPSTQPNPFHAGLPQQ
jgi:hypothetical protein